MENLHWELSVLCKAIHYKNLSGAADHVGLSQPQLSRIVSKLERELNVVLLDRAARRKSGWTPMAFKIAEIYFQSSRKLGAALSQVQSEEQFGSISIGILEGLIGLGSHITDQLFQATKVTLIEVDVFDLSDLEEKFEKDELDLILTCREPGRQKFKYIRNLGYQIFEHAGTETGLRVMSPFEYSHQVTKKQALKGQRILLSNSLALRRHWVEEFSGHGDFPSEVRKKKTEHPSEVPVHLIASELFSPALWDKVERMKI